MVSLVSEGSVKHCNGLEKASFGLGGVSKTPKTTGSAILWFLKLHYLFHPNTS
jgi:hypothetical protein